MAPTQNLDKDTTASGFFINMGGGVLTAAHAVKSCPHLFVVKDGQAAAARVIADDSGADIAVVQSRLIPLLPATLAGDGGEGESDQPVFAAAYSLLQDPQNHNVMSNGLTTEPSGDGADSNVRLSFYSGAEPGASGSAVLSTNGLVLGMIVQRETDDTSPAAASFVLGVPVSHLKAFLRLNGIGFQESDAAQLGPGQPAGARANTISAGIICG